MTTSTTRILNAVHRDKGGAIYNVMHKDFGATGLNVTDDAPAIAAALSALPTKGGRVYVPNGNYKIASNIQFTPDATVQNGGFIELVLAPGARLVPTSGVTELISFNHSVSQEAWIGIRGGVLDGTNAAAGAVGIGIHPQNVKVRDVTVKNFTGPAIKYFYDLPAPPICSELYNLNLILCKIGIDCQVSASGFKLLASRIEEMEEEGVLLRNMGHFAIGANTVIEMNGRVIAAKPQLRIKGVCYGSVMQSYFEDRRYQDHSCVIIEADTSQPRAISFIGNIVTGYNSDVTGAPNANSIGLDIAPGSGVVDGVVALGNSYNGHTTNVRIGTNSRGHLVGPDAFGDSSGPIPAWSAAVTYGIGDLASSGGTTYVSKAVGNLNHAPPNATYWTVITLKRYDRQSAQFGKVVDVNAFGSTTYDNSTQDAVSATTLAVAGATTLTGLLTANGGVKVGTATSVDYSMTRNATVGVLIRSGPGSTADFDLQNAGGTLSVLRVPTGTNTAVMGGPVVEKTTTIAYSASMTPDASLGNIQTITATNGTAFAINAPTNPRTGQRLWFRLKNIHSGALGAITPNAIYKLAGGVWPSPLNGFHRMLAVDYDGTSWQEAFRSPADIPN